MKQLVRLAPDVEGPTCGSVGRKFLPSRAEIISATWRSAKKGRRIMFKGWIRISAMTVLAFTGTFLLHWMMEWTVHTYNLGNEITEGVLASTIAGILVFHICLVGHRRRVKYQQRVEAVLTLNHHVRNALQTIVSFIDGQGATAATELKAAIDRIDWVLRDIEPRLTQHEAECQWKQLLLRPDACKTAPAMGRRAGPS